MVWFGGIWFEMFDFVFFVCFEVVFELVLLVGFFVGVFVGEDVCCDVVEELLVVCDDYGVVGEFEQCVFEGVQCFDVQVVGGFVEQQQIVVFFECQCEVEVVVFIIGQYVCFFLLVWFFEVEF